MSANNGGVLLTPATPTAGDAGVCEMAYNTDGGSDMPKSGIYQIRNLNNGKIYVGSGANLDYRFRKHGEMLRCSGHYNIHLQRSWNKHGEDAFVFEVLITCHPTMLIWYEQQFLDQWKPEFNILPTAGSWLNHRHTSDAKQKMSEALRGPEQLTQRERMQGNKLCVGLQHSAETKRKMSKVRLGKPIPSLRGRKLSEQHRQNISRGLNRAVTEGRREIRSGHTLSEEHKQKISKSLMGNQYCLGKRWTLSEEQKRRGEQVGCSKLTEEDVIAIRARLATGETREAIAADYPVCNANIGAIKQGRTWKHLL